MLAVQPITFPEACAFIVEHHRHHRPPQGWKWGLAVNDGEKDYSTCRHILRRMTREMSVISTSYSVASSRSLILPWAYRVRMSLTPASVSFELPCRSPRGCLSGCNREAFLSPTAPRPFFCMSWLLSALVPLNKCAGLQHGGLSHVWQTSRSLGMGPKVKTKASREGIHRLPLNFIWPLPVLGSRRPVQGQQSPDLSIIDQKSVSVRCMLL